jgi:hypothetical protein
MDAKIAEKKVIRINSSEIPRPLTANGTHVGFFFSLGLVWFFLVNSLEILDH